jgi:hypothetical protein
LEPVAPHGLTYGPHLRHRRGVTDEAVGVLVGALPLTSLCLAQCVEITDAVRGWGWGSRWGSVHACV